MNKLKDISKQELVLGALSTAIFLNPWLAIITAVLWACGGTFSKGIRRFGVPIAVSLFMQNPWFMLGAFPLLCGDGFPDFRPTTKDEGSDIGKWVYWNITMDEYWGGIITKCIPVVLLQLIWLLILP